MHTTLYVDMCTHVLLLTTACSKPPDAIRHDAEGLAGTIPSESSRGGIAATENDVPAPCVISNERLCDAIRQLRATPLYANNEKDQSVVGIRFSEALDFRRLQATLPLLQDIRVLSLSGSGATADDLQQLELLDAFVRVDTLDLSGNPRIDTAALKHLSHFQKLTSLDLALTNADSDCSVYLEGLPELTRIDVTGSAFRRSGYAGLEKCASLRELVALCNAITDEDLLEIGKIRQLVALECLTAGVTDVGLQHLARLDRLQVLSLESLNSSVTDRGIAHLATLRNLRELTLPNTDITNAAIPFIVQLKQLERLDLSGSNLDNEGLAPLKELRNLEYLDLRHTQVTSVAETVLAELPRLKELQTGSLDEP